MTTPGAALALLLAVAAPRPDWVDGMPAAFPRERFLVATGAGDERGAAELRARAGIAGYFESQLAASAAVREEEAVTTAKGVELRAAALSARSEAAAATAKLLEGVEIAEVWTDPGGRVHALAVLDRARAVETLRRRVAEVDAEVDALAARLAAEPARFARARLAHRLVGVSARRGPPANDLRLLDPAAEPPVPPGARAARAAAEKALAEVAVEVRATGEGAGPSVAAATRAVLAAGMRAVGPGAPHDLEALVAVEPAAPAVADGWTVVRLTARVRVAQAGAADLEAAFVESAKGTAGRAEEATRRAAEALAARIEGRLHDDLRARLEAP